MTTPIAARLLEELSAAYTRYVIFPSPDAADAVTVYTAATHAQAAWEHASPPRHQVADQAVGKTRLPEVASELVHKALPGLNRESLWYLCHH
jgi:hypothetical protein